MGSEKWRVIFPFVVLKNELDKADHSAKVAMQKKRSMLKDNEFNVIAVDDYYHGKYVSFGIGQGSHGRPADIMIVDDYVAKADNVRSETFRESLERAFTSDIIARFQASTIFMIICTRWYERDPIGLLIEKIPEVVEGFIEAGLEPPKFESIKIRAQYRISDDNPIEDPRTEEGEWLWKAMLAKYLFAKGTADFHAMYNCDTSDIEKHKQIKLEDFGFYYPDELPKHGGRIMICMDGASTAGRRSDHTAIGAWMVYGRKRYLLKLWYERIEVPKLLDLMVHILLEEYPKYNQVLIEFANSGVPVYQFLTSEMKLPFVYALGFSGKIINDNKKIIKSKKDISSKSNSKMDRYLRVIPEFHGDDKKILLPYETIEHQDIFIKQLTNFTGAPGVPDDMVDMCTYLVNYTTTNVIVTSNFTQTQASNQYKAHNMNYHQKDANYFLKR